MSKIETRIIATQWPDLTTLLGANFEPPKGCMKNGNGETFR